MNLLKINKNNKNVNTLFIIPENIEDNTVAIVNNYLKPLGVSNMQKCIFASVFTPKKGVLKKDTFEEEYAGIKEVIDTYEIENVVVTIASYFDKIMHNKKKAPFERLIGDVFEKDALNIIPCLNFVVLNISPMKRPLLQRSLNTIKEVIEGRYNNHTEEFISNLDIKLYKDFDGAYRALKDYINEDVLAIDIETTGIDRYSNKLLTISFAKSETEGFSIALHNVYTSDYKRNLKLIKSFFSKYKGKSVFHNAKFDIPFLVYHIWMSDITDTKNMIKGINSFNIDDTMIMAFLCLNAVYRPKLSLKDLAYAKYGNWDKDISQGALLSYPFDEVGRYNTIDTMATMYLYNKYSKALIEEKQEEIYNTIYKEFIPAIIKMSMNGLTIDHNGFDVIEAELDEIYNKNKNFLSDTEQVKEALAIMQQRNGSKPHKEFNPRSSNHVRVLLFDVMGLKPVKTSDLTGEPSTDRETLETLLKNEHDEQYKKILEALYEIGLMKTVKSTFVTGIKNRLLFDKKGNAKLFGEFNINGTITGRLSSKNPNLQNIPSNSKYGKIIKKNIIADKGYVIIQADFSALEDRVGANITKDPNKIKVFTEGFDGHCLAASYYFEDDLKERGIFIDRSSKDSVNSIKELAKDLRQDSKTITFKSNYGGITEYHDKYEELFSVTLHYRDKVEDFALENNFVIGAFGLKLRVDLSTIRNKGAYSKTLRTIVNMTIQSYAMLMNRTIFMMQKEIEKHGYEEDVLLQNSVHDSIYLMVKPDARIIQWVNKTLIDIMTWLPEKERKEWKVKNEAECEIGRSWIAEHTIPNNATVEQVEQILNKLYEEQ